MSLADRTLAALAALAGLAGVALSAAATHMTGNGSLQIAAQFLLFHAPALLALVALMASAAINLKLGRLAGYVLALGLVLFCGDLSRRALSGVALAPMAAPTGGVLLMLGWILAGAAAFVRPRS
ncbi:DUF423 domain-containing protein [Microvirga brassicacearum]|uniref:DUF423 domain-containing protein n=1 Tax=Microvirga brassicacearum TaxID=2580413 RepID=A0A5N3PCZ6_9HYPH|nr:DUF423 domain-containing protein [Microvirga brassicacearum]KAB0267612.1 DUF423 domain-containing protein [Microvirga brassicacearum]